MEKRAKLSPDKIALVDLETDRKITYRKLNERAGAFANFLLQKLHLQKGDRFAVLGYNSSDYIEVLYSCAKAGIILVCLNWRLTVQELKFILTDSTPKGIIFDQDFAKKVDELKELKELNFLKTFITLSSLNQQDTFNYEKILTEYSSNPYKMPPRKLDEVWHLIYTSGTTGDPKGVIQTFGMVFYNAINIGL